MCIPFHHIGINWGPLIGQRLCAPISRSWTYSDAFGNPCQNQTDAVEFKARPSIIKCKGQLFGTDGEIRTLNPEGISF